ncbi:MAG: ATP synthase F1 subunit epsilon [Polyangiaceae bacterium]
MAIELEIVTPKGRALKKTVEEVRAPSVEGEFGVLPGHLPLLAALRTGIVTYREGTAEHRVAVGTGFAEVGPVRDEKGADTGETKVVILTDDYTDRETIDPVIVRKDLADVQEELGKLLNQDATADATVAEKTKALINRENWLAAELELYGDPPPATMRPYEQFGPSPTDDTIAPDASNAPEDKTSN